MSVLLNTIDPSGDEIGSAANNRAGYDKYSKNTDLHNHVSSLYRSSATNIYRCSDGRYFHLHGSMNPDPTQDSIGLPHEMDAQTHDESCAPYVE